MNFPDALFPQAWALGAFLPLLAIWLWCFWTAPWRRLADSGQLNVWLGTVVMLVLVWSMQAGVKPGLNLHFLGATMFALMFGRQLAIIGLSLVLVGVTLNGELQGHAGWLAYGLNALVLAVFPVLLADLIRRGVERFLPDNFFIHVFVTAFFGAAAPSWLPACWPAFCCGWPACIRRRHCWTTTCPTIFCWVSPRPGSTAPW